MLRARYRAGPYLLLAIAELLAGWLWLSSSAPYHAGDVVAWSAVAGPAPVAAWRLAIAAAAPLIAIVAFVKLFRRARSRLRRACIFVAAVAAVCLTAAVAAVGALATITPQTYLGEVLDYVQQHSLYRDRVDWAAVRADAVRRARGARTTADTYPAIEYALDATKDGHSRLSTPTAGGEGYDPGFTALFPERVVVDVDPGGAADKAGLRVGDRIVRVNGRAPEGDARIHGGAEADHRRVSAGFEGDPPRLPLVVWRRGRTMRLTIAPSAAPALRVPEARMLRSGAGFLELFSVGDSDAYARAAHRALRRLSARHPCGWVVDLRRDQGGANGPMLAAVGPLLGDGDAMSYVDVDGHRSVTFSYRDGTVTNNGSRVTHVSDPVRLPHRRPVAVLTSRLTASAAEATALAFRGRRAVRSFGEPTWGVPTNNYDIRLPDGALLFLTQDAGLDHAGRRWDGPVPPDVRVRATAEALAAGRDPVLVAAERWLSRQPDCRGR